MKVQISNSIKSEIVKRFGKERPNVSQSIYNDTLKIPKKTFGRYVRNEMQPRLDELGRIANWLGVEPKELVNF